MIPDLSIACLTFNHEKYISEALDSFLNQKTGYHFDIVVGDGGSTDKNRDILKEYQQKYGEDKIKLLFPDRDPGIGGMLNQILLACEGTYIAICEGDDYWVDDQKVQRQITFLKDHSDYALIHSDIEFVSMFGKHIKPNEAYSEIVARRRDGNVFETLLDDGNFLYTPTVCFESSAIPLARLKQKENWYLFDYWYWLLISLNGKIKFEQEVTAAYRRHEHGATQQSGFFNDKYRRVHFDAILEGAKHSQTSKAGKKAIVKKMIFYLRSGLKLRDIKIILMALLIRPALVLSLFDYSKTKWKR